MKSYLALLLSWLLVVGVAYWRYRLRSVGATDPALVGSSRIGAWWRWSHRDQVVIPTPAATVEPPPDIPLVSSGPAAEYFLLRARRIVTAHLADPDFTVAQFCREMRLSNAHLHRQLTTLTGYSATLFIRHLRLQKALELLADPTLSIAAIAYDTGFSDPSYFGRVFKQEFGVTPAEWRQQQSTK